MHNVSATCSHFASNLGTA